MRVNLSECFSLIPPSPVVLVSTLSKEGIPNLAPFGMFMPVSSNPPLMALGIAETRDTFRNIMDTKEFVVAVPDPQLCQKIEDAGTRFPPQVNEFEEVGFTPAKSSVIRASRVAECQSNLECTLEWHKQAGDHWVVVGRVVAADINEGLYQKGKTRLNLNPVYHAGSEVYARRGPLIKVQSHN